MNKDNHQESMDLSKISDYGGKMWQQFKIIINNIDYNNKIIKYIIIIIIIIVVLKLMGMFQFTVHINNK